MLASVIIASIIQGVYSRRGLWDSQVEDDLDQIDIAFFVVFLIDTVLRFWAFPRRYRFLHNPKNAIDVVGLLPFFVNHVVALPKVYPDQLGLLRWMNAYEPFLRFLKLSRYFWGWQLLFHAVLDSAKALVIPSLFLCLIVILGACTLYVCESLEMRQDYQHIPVTILNLPDAIHFSVIAILSMSTGPFYNMEAVSGGAKAVVATMMAFGMLFMAMPIAIVGACFKETWFNQDRIILLSLVRSRLQAQGYRPQDLKDVFAEVDADGSGEVDFQEFKDMIKTFNMSVLTPAKLRRLFNYFDHDDDGVISFPDFAVTLYPELGVFEEEEEEEDEHSSSSSTSSSSSPSLSSAGSENNIRRGSGSGHGNSGGHGNGFGAVKMALSAGLGAAFGGGGVSADDKVKNIAVKLLQPASDGTDPHAKPPGQQPPTLTMTDTSNSGLLGGSGSFKGNANSIVVVAGSGATPSVALSSEADEGSGSPRASGGSASGGTHRLSLSMGSADKRARFDEAGKPGERRSLSGTDVSQNIISDPHVQVQLDSEGDESPDDRSQCSHGSPRASINGPVGNLSFDPLTYVKTMDQLLKRSERRFERRLDHMSTHLVSQICAQMKIHHDMPGSRGGLPKAGLPSMSGMSTFNPPANLVLKTATNHAGHHGHSGHAGHHSGTRSHAGSRVQSRRQSEIGARLPERIFRLDPGRTEMSRQASLNTNLTSNQDAAASRTCSRLPSTNHEFSSDSVLPSFIQEDPEYEVSGSSVFHVNHVASNRSNRSQRSAVTFGTASAAVGSATGVGLGRRPSVLGVTLFSGAGGGPHGRG